MSDLDWGKAPPECPVARYEKPVYETVTETICGICRATWTGRWEKHPRQTETGLVHRPEYDGGFVFCTDGKYTTVYRCKCLAGRMKGTSIPVAPAWFWRLMQEQGTPGFVSADVVQTNKSVPRETSV
jgi:hypothetical protein